MNTSQITDIRYWNYYLENLKKKRRMRILSARIFPGKFDIFKQSITSWNE